MNYGEVRTGMALEQVATVSERRFVVIHITRSSNFGGLDTQVEQHVLKGLGSKSRRHYVHR